MSPFDRLRLTLSSWSLEIAQYDVLLEVQVHYSENLRVISDTQNCKKAHVEYVSVTN